MRVAWAVAVFVLLAVIGDLVSEEICRRLERLPSMVLRLAARRLPVQDRDSRLAEWQGELDAILVPNVGLPLSRLVAGMRFAVGLAWKAGAVRDELTVQEAAGTAALSVADRSRHRRPTMPLRQGVRAEPWPWLLTALLMLAAAAAAIGSTYLHWLPCRGAMLSGSILRGYAYGPDFSDACLRRMDSGTPFPYPPEPAEQTAWGSGLGVAATVFAGLAWLALLVGQRWSVRTKIVAALPSLATFVVAVVSGVAARDTTRGPEEFLSLWLWLSIDLSAFIALVVILAWQPEVRGPGLLRVLLAMWGSTAFGFVHAAAEYVAMSTFSDANWDVPPGTGYLTGAVLIVSGVLTLTMTPPRLRPVPTERIKTAVLPHQTDGNLQLGVLGTQP